MAGILAFRFPLGLAPRRLMLGKSMNVADYLGHQRPYDRGPPQPVVTGHVNGDVRPPDLLHLFPPLLDVTDSCTCGDLHYSPLLQSKDRSAVLSKYLLSVTGQDQRA